MLSITTIFVVHVECIHVYTNKLHSSFMVWWHIHLHYITKESSVDHNNQNHSINVIINFRGASTLRQYKFDSINTHLPDMTISAHCTCAYMCTNQMS